MSGERKTSLHARSIDACLLIAVIATLWHVATASSASEALRRNDQPIGPMMDVGVRVPNAELWVSSEIERTAILVLDIACHACLASRPFYRELDQIVADTPRTRLIILSDNAIPAVRQWLDEGQIVGRAVRIPSRKALGILATPMLLLSNSEGVVTDISIGTLNQADSARFKARLRGDIDAQPLTLPYLLKEASVSEQPNIDTWIGPQLLDTRERHDFAREHSPGAVNIPDDELVARAQAELRRSQPVFVDCRYGDRAVCRLAAGRLVRQGFASVTVVLP